MAKKAAKKTKSHIKRSTAKPMRTYVIHYIAFGAIILAFVGTLYALHNVDKADILSAKSQKVQTKNLTSERTSFYKTKNKEIDAILQTLTLENANDNAEMNVNDERNVINSESTSLQNEASKIDGN